jgi:acyl-coenzyme A thioesterase PaaI-like protein
MELFYQLGPEHTPKTVNVSIDYLRPCLANRETRARAIVVKQGRRIANVRVEAYQETPAKPVAAAHAHFLLS